MYALPMKSIETIVDELSAHAEACVPPHQYEAPSWRWYASLLRDDPDDVGLAAVCLIVGCANMGTSWQDWGSDRSMCLTPPVDPAGDDWKGRPRRSGKHLLDGTQRYPWGGLGLPHADSSFLRRAYAEFGAPDGIPASVLDAKSFDQLLRTEHRGKWLDWSTALLARREAHVWLFDEHRRKYFSHAREAHPGDALAAAINTRITNSASGVGRRLAGKPIAEQIEGYRKYKLGRSQSAADRAMRQILYARRVGCLVDNLTLTALP